ncbi:hypothetical protein ACEWY4_016494 [Coilia grayii]|uniref:Zona pellucida sperm-binding protein 3 n=1 Tax=Coilia grayii TaxID=363190 RepID=A0ABD1JN72_9TELE
MATQSFTPACVVVVSLGLFCNAQQWNMPLLLRELNNKPPTLSDLSQAMTETNQLDLGRPAQNVSLVTPEPQQLNQDLAQVEPAEPAQFQPRGYQPLLVQSETVRAIQDSKKTPEPKQQTLAQGPSLEAYKPGKHWERSRLMGPAKEPLQGSMKREMPKTNQNLQSLGSRFKTPSQEPVLKPVTVESQKAPDLKLMPPEPPQTVAVDCKESSVQVEVNRDLLGNGQFIEPADLTMGGCQAVDYHDESHVLIFQSELHGCGSEIKVTLDKLIYTFTLVYNPSPLLDTPIVRTNEARLAAQCVYPRKHNVSSSALKPTWMPYASTKDREESLIFSLNLMTDDWQAQRPSSTYFLGDMMNVEGSVQQVHHEPMRVFVDNCMATMGPDINTVPRYAFIENHGCFTDAWHTGSNSQFMPRVQDNKVRFQMGTFKFHQQDTNSIYITCQLKATFASTPIDHLHKSCSYHTGRSRHHHALMSIFSSATRWVSVDGTDEVCGCCDSSCGRRKGRSVGHDGFTFQGRTALGPITVQERPFLQRLEASPDIQETQNLSIEVVVLGGVSAAVVAVCLMALGSILYSRLHKPIVPSCDNT